MSSAQAVVLNNNTTANRYAQKTGLMKANIRKNKSYTRKGV